MEPKDKFVQVRVETTSGDWPEDPEYDKTPSNQPVGIFLKKAANELGLTDTSGWILRRGDTTLDSSTTWADLGFAGLKVELDWGPRAGGGGYA